METKITIQHSEDNTLCIYSKPVKHLNQEHLRLFSEEILTIAKDRDLNFTDCRLLLAIMGLMRFENLLNLTQKQLGNEIGVEQPNIARSLKKLVKKGYLLPVGNEGKKIIYMLNPDVAFKARAKNFKTLQRCWNEKLIPNTKKMGIAQETDLDFYSKLEDKITNLARQTGIPESRVKILLAKLLEVPQNGQQLAELPY
jgi:DNA-binding MarR family transcriptional regulator